MTGLLFAALISVVGAIVPTMFFRDGEPSPEDWLRIYQVAMAALMIYWICWLPSAVAQGGRAMFFINAVVTCFIWILSSAVTLIFLFGAFGWFGVTGFAFYYSGLISMLVGMIFVFADVVLSDEV